MSVYCVKDGKWSGEADEIKEDGVTYGLFIDAPHFSGIGAKARAEEWLKKEIDKLTLNKEVDHVSPEPK